MTISSRTVEGRPNRCPVCRRRLRLSPSWPSRDAPCPHCGSLVWFPIAKASRAPAEHTTVPDFALEDFRKQFEQLERTGAIADVLAGMPKMDDRGAEEEAKQSLRRIQGMINAMTRIERGSPDIIDTPRCRRIAAGAGVLPIEVEQFLGEFRRVRAVMMQMAQMSIW
jgi:signal recognition particle GTPase